MLSSTSSSVCGQCIDFATPSDAHSVCDSYGSLLSIFWNIPQQSTVALFWQFPLLLPLLFYKTNTNNHSLTTVSAKLLQRYSRLTVWSLVSRGSPLGICSLQSLSFSGGAISHWHSTSSAPKIHSTSAFDNRYRILLMPALLPLGEACKCHNWS